MTIGLALGEQKEQQEQQPPPSTATSGVDGNAALEDSRRQGEVREDVTRDTRRRKQGCTGLCFAIGFALMALDTVDHVRSSSSRGAGPDPVASPVTSALVARVESPVKVLPSTQGFHSQRHRGHGGAAPSSTHSTRSKISAAKTAESLDKLDTSDAHPKHAT